MKRIFTITMVIAIFLVKISYSNDAFPLAYDIDAVRNEKVIFAEDIEYSIQNDIVTAGYTLNVKNNNGNKIIQLGKFNLLEAAPFGSSILLFYSDGNSGDVNIIGYNADGVLFLNSIISCDGMPVSKLKVADIYRDNLLVLCNENLLYGQIRNNNFTYRLVAENVKTAAFRSNGDFAFVNATQSGMNLLYVDNNNYKTEIITKLTAYDNIKLKVYRDTVVAISGGEGMDNSSLIQVVTLKDGIIRENWIDASMSLAEVIMTDNGMRILCLNTRMHNRLSVRSLTMDHYDFSIYLNENFIEPYHIGYNSGKIIIVFRNGITEINRDGRILAEDNISFGKYFRQDVDMLFHQQAVVISSNDVSLVLICNRNKLWRITAFYRGVGRRIIPILFVAILLCFLRYIIKQQSLLRILLEQAGRGVVIRLGKNGKLIGINSAGKNFLGIDESVPKHQKFDYYCSTKDLLPFRYFVSESVLARESDKDKITINNGDKSSDWVFSSIPIHDFWGNFRGMIISGMDITEELEKKRLNNWASLAHDMQTNLSTIRLNAEQITEEQGSDNFKRRNKIIHQVNILIQRVRDIVTVGRSDELNKEFYSSDDICREVISEFDSVMFPNATLKLNVSNIKVYCDRPKMVRAIRNAIENAIRSLKGDQGTVTLSNAADSQNIYFKIKDTGIGMTDEVKAKMLIPYFTTGAKEGGFGIGTMVMQQVIKLHGGRIEIHSEYGKGTEMIFAIPNISQVQVKLQQRKKI